MTSITKLFGVGLLGSIGLTFLILGCVISGKWWSLLLFIFYGFTPLPLLFVRGTGYDNFGGEESNKSLDWAVFFVAGMVVSTLALPILLTKVPVDEPGMNTANCFFAEFATVIFYTTAGLFITSVEEESY